MEEKPDNPYQAPLAEQLPAKPRWIVPPTIAYAAIGCVLGFGVGFASALSLSNQLFYYWGAPSGALLGYLLGLSRSRK